MTPPPRLGIDIGRVLIRGYDELATGDTPFVDLNKMTDEENLAAPATEGMWDHVPDVVEHFKSHGGDVWLISKAVRTRTKELTQKWLDGHKFWERTGMDPANLIFTPTRDSKVRVCQHAGINHFVDDRVDCLKPMVGVVPVRVLFGAQTELAAEWAKQTQTLWALNWAAARVFLQAPERFVYLNPGEKP